MRRSYTLIWRHRDSRDWRHPGTGIFTYYPRTGKSSLGPWLPLLSNPDGLFEGLFCWGSWIGEYEYRWLPWRAAPSIHHWTICKVQCRFLIPADHKEKSSWKIKVISPQKDRHKMILKKNNTKGNRSPLKKFNGQRSSCSRFVSMFAGTPHDTLKKSHGYKAYRSIVPPQKHVQLVGPPFDS